MHDHQYVLMSLGSLHKGSGPMRSMSMCSKGIKIKEYNKKRIEWGWCGLLRECIFAPNASLAEMMWNIMVSNLEQETTDSLHLSFGAHCGITAGVYKLACMRGGGPGPPWWYSLFCTCHNGVSGSHPPSPPFQNFQNLISQLVIYRGKGISRMVLFALCGGIQGRSTKFWVLCTNSAHGPH